MASQDIISRLAARYSTATKSANPDPITRDIGGQFRDNQPYISGYFQIMVGLPAKLFANNAESASKWLHSTCEGFTPHTQTLTKVDVQGQGQIGSSFVANVTTTREFTLTFREYQHLPILNTIKQWGAIFDPFTGVSPLKGSEFIPVNYKGWVAVVQTKPVKSSADDPLQEDDVEEAYLYQGAFPTNIPIDTASSSDITGNDTIQHSITFSFDNSPLTTSEVPAKTFIELFKDVKSMDTFDKYLAIKPSAFGSSAEGKTENLSGAGG